MVARLWVKDKNEQQLYERRVVRKARVTVDEHPCPC